jgi:CRISPR-associated protein (TIGR03986 family)
MAWPHHVNPQTHRMATAPYNFVPLPQRVLDATALLDPDLPLPWKAQDRYLPGTHSGWIDLSITTLTPLFIRGPAGMKDKQWDTREARLRPEPAMTVDGRPVIPGSSLRGMLRTLVEILAFAKVTAASEHRPFFRTVGTDRVGIAYRNRVVTGGIRPEGGFVTRSANGWFITPARDVVRVPHAALEPVLGYRNPPNYWPTWDLQHRPCWVKRAPGASTIDQISYTSRDTWERGTLVLTGAAPPPHAPDNGKQAEFVFLAPDSTDPQRSLRVPDEVWDRFHDDDQISQWQREAFPLGQPHGHGRAGAGQLRDGEPVFFIRNDDNTVKFLGRAQMFRLPYDLSLADLVPADLRFGQLDVAEAIFGRIGGHDYESIKGRIFVEDSVAVGKRTDWYESAFVPRILSGPKPTTYSHYLTQDADLGTPGLTTYLVGDLGRTVARGHKLYWHRATGDDFKTLAAEANQPLYLRNLDAGSDTQHTRIQPVKEKITFRGKIRFDNLASAELGAVLTALRLRDGCAHKLGMGKPLGLGSIKVTPTLFLVDRATRYGSWSASGSTKSDGDCYIAEFRKAVIDHADESDEAVLPDNTGLDHVARIDALFVMLDWDHRPAPEQTETMGVRDFRDKKVLPTPYQVAGQPEPVWTGPRPKPAPLEKDTNAPPRPPETPTAASTPSDPRQPVRCIVQTDRTPKGGWIFLLPDGRTGVLHPRSIEKSPSDLAAGQRHELIIVGGGDRHLQLAWPSAMTTPGANPGRPRPRRH